MTTASAADGDGQTATTILQVGVERGIKIPLDCIAERDPNSIAKNECLNLRTATIERAQLRNPVRISRRTNIKDEVGFEGNAMLEAEGEKTYGEAFVYANRLTHKAVTQLSRGEIAGIDLGIGRFTHSAQQCTLYGDCLCDGAWRVNIAAEGVAMARLAEAPNEHIVTCIEKDRSYIHTSVLGNTADRAYSATWISIARINHQTGARKSNRIDPNLLDERR